MNYPISINKISESRLSKVDFSNLGFGKVFSDHMFVADYKDGVWKDLRIVPFDYLPMHPAMSSIHYGQSIFEGVCVDCHVTKGIGKIGKELYDADCAICHGDAKDHKPHGPIDKNTAVKYTDDELVNYIKNGSPTNPTMMPGFHKDAGGPLTTDEIMTILAYIRSDLSVNSFIK